VPAEDRCLPFVITLPKRLQDEVRQAAFDHHDTVSGFVRKCLEAHFNSAQKD
jgi:hypothetical protein